MNPRPYRMRKRAEGVDQTRLRITEAAVRLHTTVGPANTTLSAVAEEAGVSRVTLYRHFADEAQLFAACSSHWEAHHPPPDAGAWLRVAFGEGRARIALTELYGWYRDNADALFLFERDAEALPPEVQAGWHEGVAAMAGILLEGSRVRGGARRRLRAAAGHVVSYSTWRSLVVEQALDQDAAVDLAVAFFIAASP